MQKVGSILVASENREKARHIAKIFGDANFLNPIAFATNMARALGLMRGEDSSIWIQLLFVELSAEWIWDLLEAFKEEENHSKIPIIALVNGNEALLDKAYEAGVKSYLKLPFTFAEFLERSRLLQLKCVLTSADAKGIFD
jgi:CheY-like chemotaxis protein